MATPVDPSHYVIEYAKNSNEKCNGNPPCHGSTIVVGDLRLGTKRYNGTINVKMQHWGCTTPDMLYDLAFIDVNRIPGMEKLSAVDKVKIHKAVQDLRIDPADVPITARPLVRGPALPSSSQGNNAPRVATAPFGSQRTAAPSPFMAPSTSASALASRKRKTSNKAKPTASQKSPIASPVKSALSTPSSSQASGSQAPRYVPPTPAPPAYMGTQITMSQQKRDDEEYVDEGDYEDEDEFSDFYVLFHTSVVGIQYYDGLVGPGEQVLLVREPLNQYDRNAIQVMNMNNHQVGHIPRAVAANLAPLMDRQLIAVEGTMNDGNLQGRQFQLSVSLNIYGRPGVRTILEPLLRWATPGKRGFTDAMRAESGVALTQTQGYSAGASGGPSYAAGPSQNPMAVASSQAITQLSQQAADAIAAHRRAEELRVMLAGLEKVDDEGRRANFLDALYGTEAEDILNLPEHESPPSKEEGSLTVDLLKHQKQGLLWCINRENAKLPEKAGDPHQQFWELRQPPNQKPHYMSLITKTPLPMNLPPSIGYGGIMSDSMGLGKSLTFLALILATKDVHPDHFDNPTLIVCPLSVLSNWETQIADHVTAGALTTYTYYGNNRNVDPDVLKAYDVVLTTYQSVSSDFERSGGFKTADQLLAESEARKRVEAKGKVPDKPSKGLFAVKWKRVVLDEAHQIRNPKTKIAQAVTAIDGYYRWAVSGTPIVNSPTDLGSLLAFLRMCPPLDRISNFNRLLARPLSKGEATSMNLLREIMKHISIRRSKEMQNADGKRLVDLPKVIINVTRVQLDEDTRRIYNSVEALSRQRFMAMANAAQDGEHVPNVVLSLLTRMRQIALHPGLVPADYLDTLRADNEEHAEQYNFRVPGVISAQEKARLQNILFHAEEDSEECAICFDNLKQPRILPDGHYFCYECIAGLIQAHGAEATCPMDRRPIAMEDLIEPAPPIASTQAPRDVIEHGLAPSHGSSAKIDRLIGILKLIPADEKAVVFSQFTSFLDKIADQLEVHGISFVQFNGGLSAKRRQEVLQSFSRPLAVRRTGKRTASQAQKKAGESGSDSDSDYVPKYDEDDFIDDDGSFFTATQTGKAKAKASTKGKGKGKGKTTTSRSSGGNPKILLISLKSGATGLNLTVANHLFLMDPWWQEAIESQAIDRVNRIGQKRDVQVYQMITDDTVESKVLEIQARKKAMIDQAFSGMVGREVAREKRETRMQDFIDLFGLKRQGGRVTLGEEAAAAQKAIDDDDDDELEWVPVGRSKRARLAVSDDDDRSWD